MKLLLTFLAALCAGLASAAAADKPNVLLLIADDMNCALGTYGHPLAKTPALDRLAGSGVRFDRAYCQFPLCNPSRASLLSGRWPATTKVLDNNTRANVALQPFKLLPQTFREHGYRTARIGKILHHGMDIPTLWDKAEEASMKDNTERQFQRKAADALGKQRLGQKTDAASEHFLWAKSPGAEEDFGDAQKAGKAIEWLEEFAKEEKPFFLAVGFLKPHHPYVAPAKYFEHYPLDKISWAQEPPDHLKEIPPIALTAAAGSREMTEARRREIIAAYLACISLVDAQAGRVLDTLDRLKLAGKTIVLFLGDHGYHLGEHGTLWHKLSLFDESARAPLIIRAPGKAANGKPCARPVQFLDLYPTLAALCGLPTPPELDGHDLSPLLDNPAAPWPHAAFSFVAHGRTRNGAAVSTERYRYIEWQNGAAGAQLYDSQSDPHELKNLAKDPQHTATVAELKKLLSRIPKPY
ncbi:MAG: sulfatase [Verrucomicrobiota bacterium]|nr:sulfatase [Verrucomicrobiota bacterium]